MGARTRLNVGYVHGALAVAGLIAAVVGSWPLFWLAAAVLLATAVYCGDIRLGRRRR